MTPEEHYAEAESYLESAARHNDDTERQRALLAFAHAHARLADRRIGEAYLRNHPEEQEVACALEDRVPALDRAQHEANTFDRAQHKHQPGALGTTEDDDVAAMRRALLDRMVAEDEAEVCAKTVESEDEEHAAGPGQRINPRPAPPYSNPPIDVGAAFSAVPHPFPQNYAAVHAWVGTLTATQRAKLRLALGG